MDSWYVYILKNTECKKTYVGMTNNLKRRIRQHNKEICGGAKYTTNSDGKWEYLAYISGLTDHRNTLSCEWKLKHICRTRRLVGIKGRITALKHLLTLKYWTQNCTICNDTLNIKLHVNEKYEDEFSDFEYELIDDKCIVKKLIK